MLPDNITTLLMSGAGGAYFRAVFDPEPNWKRRAVTGSAGAVSAVFLGGFLGNILDAVPGVEPQAAYLAAGFLMGEGGISMVQHIRRKFFPDPEKDKVK